MLRVPGRGRVRRQRREPLPPRVGAHGGLIPHAEEPARLGLVRSQGSSLHEPRGDLRRPVPPTSRHPAGVSHLTPGIAHPPGEKAISALAHLRTHRNTAAHSSKWD